MMASRFQDGRAIMVRTAAQRRSRSATENEKLRGLNSTRCVALCALTCAASIGTVGSAAAAAVACNSFRRVGAEMLDIVFLPDRRQCCRPLLRDHSIAATVMLRPY